MDIESFIKFCEEKGFFYNSEEIYGGKTGFYDYGSLGKILELKFENLWRNFFLKLYPNFWEIEPSEVMKDIVFKASGHLELFNDPITECKNGHRFRADKLIEETLKIKVEGLSIKEINEIIREKKMLCPICKSELSEVRLFNLMVPAMIGPEQDLFLLLEDYLKSGKIDKEELLESYKRFKENRYFLRPETAQGAYVNFPIEIIINRYKLPLGLAIIGKAYRNEISPRNALIRMREFKQAELQIFFVSNEFDELYERVKDKEINVLLVRDRERGNDFIKVKLRDLEGYLPKFYLYFMYKIQQFYLDVLRIPKDRFRFYELSEKEKAFYNMYHFDVEVYLDSLGWIEVGGIHFRAIKLRREDLERIGDRELREKILEIFGDKEEVIVGYDLWKHLIYSKNTNFIVNINNRKVLPIELELSFGVDRNIFSILWVLYDERSGILKLPPYLAPIEVAVFPLLESKDKHVEKAREIFEELRLSFIVYYDDSGSIGKRYRRQDSIGTPFCITIDERTFEDNTVTIRYRDTKEQIRIKVSDIKEFLKKELNIYFLEDIVRN
ncbi:MAG: hypothetical protein BXU00_02900 [Candidatus Nanoclepta minutus]|uniref:Aminoacyl-transfer RNA synthetases class-II family profile domain-containing protein n=1 Tax=Candidatus Nanoclepta minutus TaxID=1940235 RepID=A0A397WP19_9ARCH|nr:MAG: hypothetical protein BXU00_02900 [Candidatus Nanoclepta minutus]